MNEQLDMLTWIDTHSRRSDPSTSREAARQAPGLAHDHWAKIVAYLQSIAPRGATIEGIAAGTGIDKVAVARRMNEIEGAGAFWSGTELLSTNRPGRVWFARTGG